MTWGGSKDDLPVRVPQAVSVPERPRPADPATLRRVRDTLVTLLQGQRP